VADAVGPIYGIIDQPFIGERFEGGLGRARVRGPQGEAGLRTRAPRPLSEATLLSTFPEIGTEAERAAFRRVADRARLVRYGLDCYGYALLALGEVDLVIEAGLQPYDVAAPIAVVRAAGGLATAWDGGPAEGGGRDAGGRQRRHPRRGYGAPGRLGRLTPHLCTATRESPPTQPPVGREPAGVASRTRLPMDRSASDLLG
jgi:fructose-1,6-bisphosphatase/inositol monophosphatase family enzyme